MPHSLLFVDDEEYLLSIFRDFFVGRGFLVDCATELEEGLALLDCREYSLVVCDISLDRPGGAEGLEIVSYVRSYCPSTKIVVLTASRSDAIHDRALANGVDLLLLKPQSLGHLAATFDELLMDGGTTHVVPSR